MSLYEERPGVKPQEEVVDDSPYTLVTEQLSTLIDFNDSVIYLNDDITEMSLVDFMIKVRAILSNRNKENMSPS